MATGHALNVHIDGPSAAHPVIHAVVFEQARNLDEQCELLLGPLNAPSHRRAPYGASAEPHTWGREAAMAWEVNDAEFESVLRLPGPRRYEYFVTRAASHGELWGLRAEDGWVVAEDDDREQHLPVWPHQRFVAALATGDWGDANAVAIDVDEWVEGWLPNLARDGMRVAVFQTPSDEGVSVAPERLSHDLETELEKFQM